MTQVEPGQLVISCAGRDKGRYMLVLGIIDKDHVLVVDGNLRKIQKPKKKKIKHLKILNKKSGMMLEKIEQKRNINDIEIQKALDEIVDDVQE